MASPITECQKALAKAQRQLDKVTMQRLTRIIELEEENKTLREVAARLDTRLDIQIDFFDAAMDKAGTLGELKLWWKSFLYDSQNLNPEDGDWEAKAKAIHEKHDLRMDVDAAYEIRLQKMQEWNV